MKLAQLNKSTLFLQVITALADYLSVKCVLCCGGKNNVGEMTKSVGQGTHIVVGTPGRIIGTFYLMLKSIYITI